MQKGGLGRGLGSLIPGRFNDHDTRASVFQPLPDAGERVINIPLNQISANPFQPRENFDYSELEDLVESVKKHGILQPIIVSPAGQDKYQLIAGERRFKAVQILELATVPCLVRQAEELDKLEMALIENIQRSNLNPME